MLIILHLSLMIAATLCLIAGIGIAMFRRKKKNWLKLHKTFNTTGLIIGFAGVAMAITNVVTSGGHHFAGIHQWIGLAAVISCCLTLFLGFYSFQANNKVTVRMVHRWLGRLSLIAILAALILGLMMIGIL